MRMVFGLVLIIGVALAGFAVYMAQGYLAKTTAERNALIAAQQKAKPTVNLIVVKKDKAYGERLTPEDVVAIRWQKDSLPDGHYLEMEDLFPVGKDPRTVITAMNKFEPVLKAKVTEPGEDAGITSRLDKGKRAFAIKVDRTSGVSGFLRPGDRVDVYWTGSISGREVTKLIETSIKLIAVDQTYDEGHTSPSIARTVTVAISPDQVASLAQAQSTGRLSLALVGAEDETVAEEVEVDQKRLLGIQEKEVREVEVQRVCTTKVRKGAEVVEQPIPCTN
ncbi:Flp pilus assembly protein CpaB [Vannielia litorea]|uniref:Flp pilus assembly protein CpaB n=1 Tax=Vannielia litorea TaxID=1217970 RepID=UPI001C94B156|nr:Flp pilus assembly protein CpaB [Vannielia litorea]MBY6048159.1 Flp pilus assembly protein CpaB [Vannielia litorea]MBY6075573.1 Flp pilus assembly protein CpaB [Vannielia litorea]